MQTIQTPHVYERVTQHEIDQQQQQQDITARQQTTDRQQTRDNRQDRQTEAIDTEGGR
jgi:hypothetical protein